MSFRDLWVIKENDPKNEPTQDKTVEPSSTVKFPTQSPTSEPSKFSIGNIFNFGGETPSNTQTPKNFTHEHLEKALEVYQRGFDSLNQDGYDFYEYYQAVTQSGVDNPQVYSMAFTMAKVMDKSLSIERLIASSDFYQNEINKVFNDFVLKGNSKKQELSVQQSNETQALSNELSLMEQQLEALKIQIEDRRNKLNAIDGKYKPQINEIDSKLAANEEAKNKIIESIQQVKNGILNNLK